MNYVYDVLLNFNKEFYDFYDWNTSDTISHIRKIMIFKISDKILYDLINSNIEVDHDFLVKISNRTEVFTKQNVKIINYACLFTNGSKVIGIKFDKNGYQLEKSALLVDEEVDILDSVDDFEDYQLNYKKIKNNNLDYFKTRKDKDIEKFIQKNLKNINNNDSEKIKYLYYECFNKRENNLDKMLSDINKELKNNWDLFYMKIYNFFKLISVKGK